jgi:hypothetical protein
MRGFFLSQIVSKCLSFFLFTALLTSNLQTSAHCIPLSFLPSRESADFRSKARITFFVKQLKKRLFMSPYPRI